MREDADAAFFGEFDRVVREVEQDLEDLLAVAAERDVRRVEVRVEREFFLQRSRREALHDFADHVLEREGFGDDFHLSRLDAREVEEVVDQGQQMLGGEVDHPELLELLGIERPRETLAQDAGEADDRVQRRAQFVAHHRHEFRFQPVEFLEPLVGFREVPRALADFDFEIVARLAQRALGLLALDYFEAERDVIGHRAGEVFFVGRPCAHRARVFVAEHAHHFSARANGRIEHRGDAERLQIRLRELARLRIGARIIRRDRALFGQRREVGRIVARREFQPARMLLAVHFEEILAADHVAAFVEHPDAHAPHLQRVRREFRDPTESSLHVCLAQRR